MPQLHQLRAKPSDYLKPVAAGFGALAATLGLIVFCATRPAADTAETCLLAAGLAVCVFGAMLFCILRKIDRQRILLTPTHLCYRDANGSQDIDRKDVCFCRKHAIPGRRPCAAETVIQIYAREPERQPIAIPPRLFFRPEMLRWVDGIPMDTSLQADIRAHTAIRALNPV